MNEAKEPVKQGATPADSQTPITPGPTQSVTITPARPDPIPTATPMSLPPTTTAAEDVTTAGQRRINLIWEITQAVIAIAITGAIIYNSINAIQSDVLTNAFFLIVSMYFVRTNHTLVGGVGAAQSVQSTQGR